MDTAAPRATQYSGLMSLTTFLMISMLPIHLTASAACRAFRAVVLHAGQERRRQKLEAVEMITCVYRCPTALWSLFPGEPHPAGGLVLAMRARAHADRQIGNPGARRRTSLTIA
jgi:hypothetical protein